MSTSLLYHGFGVRGYSHVKFESIDGGVVFTAERRDRDLCCGACGSAGLGEIS